MRKTLAIICFVVVALSVIWEVTMCVNNHTLKAGVREMEIEKNEGVKETIRVDEEWIAVGSLKVLVGSTIVAQPDGLDLRNGSMIEISQTALCITTVLRWLTIIVCLAAGICLYKTSMSKTGKVQAA